MPHFGQSTSVACHMRLVIVLILSAFVLLTNRWLSYEDGIHIMMAGTDIQSSMSIARSAPALPDEPLPFHHAQRIAVAYAVGLAAKAFPLSHHIWFTLTTLLCFALIVGIYLKILDRLRTAVTAELILVSLLILNPYSFRYYFAVPGRVYDLVFVLGLSLALLGLFEGRFSKVFVGLTVASLGRQTGLLMLPALSLWIFLGTAWKGQPLRFKALAVTSLVVSSLTIHFLTGQLAAQFATPSSNVEHLTRIFHWVHDAHRTGALAEFVIRAMIPMSFPICMLLGIYWGAIRRPTLTFEFWACLVFSFLITLQPFLAGPDLSGDNIVRLSAIGLIPWLAALALVLRETHALDHPQALPFGLLQSLIVVGSFHHMYTYIGGETAQALRFSMIYFSLAAVGGCLAYFIAKSSAASVQRCAIP